MDNVPALLTAFATFIGLLFGGAWQLFKYMDSRQAQDRKDFEAKQLKWELEQSQRINDLLASQGDLQRKISLLWEHVYKLEAELANAGQSVPPRPTVKP